jgi:tetratricopeptide (TPR) repeat protein
MKRLVACTALLLASVFVAADDPKQAELKKKPQWQRMLTGEDTKTAAGLMKRIADSETVDDYTGAIGHAKQLLELRTRTQGSDHYESISARFKLEQLNKIASLSVKAQGDWGKATREYAKGNQIGSVDYSDERIASNARYLELCKAILGEEHPLVATVQLRVALDLHQRKKTTEALAIARKSLENRLKSLGEDHLDTANGYSALGGLLSENGRYLEAEPMIKKAFALTREILGDKSAIGAARNMTSIRLHFLVKNLESQGKFTEAEQYHRFAIDVRREYYGDEFTYTVDGYRDLAANLRSQGKLAECELLLRKALALGVKFRGEEYPDTVELLRLLASCVEARGRAVEAELMWNRVVEINRNLWGENHSQTAANCQILAHSMLNRGKIAEAERLSAQALDIKRRIRGGREAESESSEHLRFLAKCRSAAGAYAEAEELLRKSTAIELANSAQDRLPIASLQHDLAFYQLNQGKIEDAASSVRMALDTRRKILTEDHPTTAQSLELLAIIHARQGRSEESRRYDRKVLEIRRRVYGEAHLDTARSHLRVALGEVASRQTSEAIESLQRAVHSFESSRLTAAVGLDRAMLNESDPRPLLAALQCVREPKAAWGNLEASLARGLLDQVTREQRVLNAREKNDLENTKYRLDDLQSQIAVLTSKGNATPPELSRLNELYRDLRAAEESISAITVAVRERTVALDETIRRSLALDAAILTWIDVQSRDGAVSEHFACVVRPTGEPVWSRLPGTGPEGRWTNRDQDLPAEYRAAILAGAPVDEIAALASRLQTQRIAPVIRHLEGVNHLLVVPVHMMAGVPVEALAPTCTVAYVPSGTFLAKLRDRPKPSGHRMLAIGDPIYEDGSRPEVVGKPLPPGGLLITQVLPGSIAAKVNLKPGDVLLKYGEADLSDQKSVTRAMAANDKKATSTVTVWRGRDEKPVIVEIATGKLGVVFDSDPAPIALAARSKFDDRLARLARGGEWNDLPGTRVETGRLSQLFGESAKVLVDHSASEEAVEGLRVSGELAKYRYLHFATHGEGNTQQAFESALILSQNTKQKFEVPPEGLPFINGQLSAREVLDYWKLDAELVTLSACETAIGKKGGGDGLLGFTQAFLTAGARSVCLSLWKVDDAATALLMSRFYENLLGKREGLTKPMGKAVALDEAKRWLRNLSGEEAAVLTAKISNGVARGARGKNVDLKVVATETKDAKPFAHPKFWAAFILIGDPN